jgi:hypothetical protein
LIGPNAILKGDIQASKAILHCKVIVNMRIDKFIYGAWEQYEDSRGREED